MAKRIARLSALIALALVLGYVERLIPLPMPVPGAKVGLANLVTVVTLCLFGFWDALTVGVLRVLLGGLLFGTGASILYALCGALLSLFVMALLHRAHFHPVALSAAGGVAHNLAQLGAAIWVTRTPGLLLYLPYLIVLGILTGIAIGIVGAVLIRRLGSALFISP